MKKLNTGTQVIFCYLLIILSSLCRPASTKETELPPVRDPAPPMPLDRLGDYRRTVAVESDEAQQWFDQGVALMIGYTISMALLLH